MAHSIVDTLSEVVEQAAVTIVITDGDGVIEYVNPAFESLTGYSREMALGRTPRLLRSLGPRFTVGGPHRGDSY